MWRPAETSRQPWEVNRKENVSILRLMSRTGCPAPGSYPTRMEKNICPKPELVSAIYAIMPHQFLRRPFPPSSSATFRTRPRALTVRRLCASSFFACDHTPAPRGEPDRCLWPELRAVCAMARRGRRVICSSPDKGCAHRRLDRSCVAWSALTP